MFPKMTHLLPLTSSQRKRMTRKSLRCLEWSHTSFPGGLRSSFLYLWSIMTRITKNWIAHQKMQMLASWKVETETPVYLRYTAVHRLPCHSICLFGRRCISRTQNNSCQQMMEGDQPRCFLGPTWSGQVILPSITLIAMPSFSAPFLFH